LLKNSLSEKYSISFLKNSEIMRFIPQSNSPIRARLLKSPTRTLSGISPIAIMPPPAACPGRCIYCPKGENAPQSYTGYEPTTMRAIESGYSAKKQVESRLRQYASQGHATDKCHLIIMGGTFLCVEEKIRHAFMKDAFDALNGKKSSSMQGAIGLNESAKHRAIGVTFETRPDFGFERHADDMLAMAGTQVELGVQCLSDAIYRKVRRGHSVADVVRSTKILKNSGFKLTYHMMPGLFSTPKEDVGYFRRLFFNEKFQPDMLKIYPALVLQGTGLYQLWKAGKYRPYDTETAAEVIADATKYIPPYVRIPRIQRDIPVPLISAGVKNSNLKQIVDRKLSERGEKCRCIRCREIGSSGRKNEGTGKLKLDLQRTEYRASGGKEIFLSFEDEEKDLLAAFLRLRIPGKSHRAEIGARASIVRELHVYGQEAAIGEYSPLKLQHTGLGRKLLSEAEAITHGEFGLEKIAVISGPGARGYYRKFGYSLDGPYMAKKL
jgi:elongator complex protein 3